MTHLMAHARSFVAAWDIAQDGQPARGEGVVHSQADEGTLSLRPAPVGPQRWLRTGDASGPVRGRTRFGEVAVACAGGLVNTSELHEAVFSAGGWLPDGRMASLVLALMAGSGQRTAINALVDALQKLSGGWAVAVLVEGALVVGTDPHGMQQVHLGRLGEGWVLADDPAELWSLGAVHERVLDPGEVLVIRKGRTFSLRPFPQVTPHRCLVALLRPLMAQGWLGGDLPEDSHRALGAQMAHQMPTHGVKMVVPLTAGSNALVEGYAGTMGLQWLPLQEGVPVGAYANRLAKGILTFVGRTDADLRALAAWRPVLERAGVSGIHIRTAVAPFKGACPYGRDLVTGALQEGGASLLSVKNLPVQALHRWANDMTGDMASCHACLGGPLPVPEPVEPDQLGLFKEGEAKNAS